MATTQMKTSQFLTVLIIFNLVFAVHCQEACGDKCSCIQTSTTFSYDCRARQLTVAPVGVSSNATTLNLSNNQIRMLIQGSFNNLRKLEYLYLQANEISYIQPGTLNGMMRLKQLIISSNLLTEIERDTFAHLPSLEVLDLSQNRITTINRYALFTLPSLYLVNFAQNSLICGCEEMMLQEFFDQRGSDLIVDNALCVNYGVDLSLIRSVNAMPCPTIATERLFQDDMRCYSCSGAKGVRDCITDQVQLCSGATPVCFTRMDYYYPGSLLVSGGCMDYQTCLNQEVRNADTCMYRGGSVGTTCTFCDPDTLGNYRDVVNTTKEFDIQLLIQLALDMTPQLQDSSSPEYDSFTKNLRQEVDNYIQGKQGSYITTFLDLRSPRVTMSFIVHCATMWFNSQSYIMEQLTAALSTRRFNGFNVEEINMYTIGKAKCQSETIADAKYGTITWPPTDPGAIAFVQCPYQLESATVNRYAYRNCKREVDSSGTWLEPDFTNCPQVDTDVRDLENLANTDVTENNVEDISSDLSDLSSGWSDFETTQVDWTVSVIDGILQTDKSATSQDVIDNTLDSVNNVLFIDENLLSDAEKEYQTSNRLVAAVDRLLTNVDISSGDVKLQRDNIAGLVTGVSGTGFNGLSMSYQHDGINSLTDTQISLRESESSLDDGQSGIVLPNTLFRSLSASKRSSIGKVSLSVYRNAKLFSSITQTNNSREITRNGDTVKVETKINSNVISATVPNQNIRNLQSPVVVTLRHVNAGENASCVYWDTNADIWSTSGCVVNYTSKTITICHCDHLTNFALLMDVYGTGGDMSEVNKLVLSIISYIGCGLSLFGVACTLFTYLKFRKLRRDNPSKILMNLCVAIGMVDIVFLVGVQPYASSSAAGCKIIAILLHYFLLSALCWMMVEAFYMYLALVKIFDTYIAHFQMKSALFGWGIPLANVAITLGINKTDNYGIQPGGICWLFQIPFYAAFLAPVCIMLIVNTIIYILVMRQIITRSSSKLAKTDTSNTAVRLRGAAGLLILLGLTWVFAILAVDDFGIVFHYLFAIFNSAQGFFIFIFYCCLKKEAQQCWRKSLPCLKSPYEQTTSSNTQSRDTTSTLDTNKTMKTTVQSKDDTGESSVPTGQPTNSAFRGRWQVQVADPKPQSKA